MAAPAQLQQEEQREDDKVLRGQIRGLLNRAKHDKHQLVSVENNKIVEYIEQSNQYVDQVTRPRDMAVHAELFNVIADAGLDYIGKMKQGSSTHTAADLLRRLKTRFVEDEDAQQAGAEDPDAFHWAGLGALPSVAALFRSVPVVHHMLGPMDAAPRARRVAQRTAARRAPLGEAVRPEEVEDFEDAERQETDRSMEEMWEVIKAAGGRVTVLDLVINHASFAQTVENLFTLSFLVRDNRVALEPDEQLGMIVQKREVKKGDKGKDREAERMQFVISLDIETWEAWKQATDPARPPMMKHRTQQEEQQEQREQQQRKQRVQREQHREQQREQQQQQREQQQQQPEEEPEDEAPPQQKRQQQDRGAAAAQASRQQAQQQLKKQLKRKSQPLPDAGGDEDEAPPSSGRRKSQRGKTPQRQQEQQQPPTQRQERRAARQPTPQRQASSDVVVIADSDSVIVIDDSTDGEERSPNRKPLPAARAAQVKQEPATQPLGTQGQASQRRPMRGKR